MALPPRQRVTPLNWQTPMVDPATGYPTPLFIRLWQQLFGNEEGTSADATTALTDAEAALAATEALEARQIATGFGLSGGGNLTADRTLSLGNPALTDPNADRGLFWDDSAGRLDWLTYGTGLTLTGTTLTASGGGGGGGGTLMPFELIDTQADSNLLLNAQLLVVAAPAVSAAPITGVVLSSRAVPVGQQAAPVIYEGPLWASGAAVEPNSTTLVASGPFVTPTANTFNPLPFSAPFTPTVGRTYFVGFSFMGPSNFVLMNCPTRRFWSVAGTFNPPPATFSASPTPGANNVCSWWTY
jgi:hypothetical protein